VRRLKLKGKWLKKASSIVGEEVSLNRESTPNYSPYYRILVWSPPRLLEDVIYGKAFSQQTGKRRLKIFSS